MKFSPFLSISASLILFWGVLLISSCNKDEGDENIYSSCCSHEPQFLELGDEYYSVANVFTPNFDGVNDIFRADGSASTDSVILFEVYDKSDNLIYKQNSVEHIFTSRWTGVVSEGQNSGDLYEGSFDYTIEIRNLQGESGIIQGQACAVRDVCNINLAGQCNFPTQYNPSTNDFDSGIPSGEECEE